MIKYDIDENNYLLRVYPSAPLSEDDFKTLNSAVNKLIKEKGVLTGIIIEAENFPGWDSFGAMVKHFKFIKNNHTKVNKIALVTDTKLANFAEIMMSHFIAAEIKKFPAGQAESAKKWIVGKK